MKLFSKVAIVGTGLIGGSIALDIKKKKLAHTVIGISRHRRTLLLAKKAGAIDIGSTDLNAVREADLVILATPVNTIMGLAEKISGLVKTGCIVTDVGSTKKEIVCGLSKIFARFVGSHPLAGSEKRGIANAMHGLFQNSLCIITPVKGTDALALGKIKTFWKALGSKIIILNPEKHDRILSFVSHLPHAAAFSLIDSVPDKYFGLAPASLKEMTRIASSEAVLWADVFLSNRKNVLGAIGSLEKNLSAIKSSINKKDRPSLIRIISRAKHKRETFE